MSEFISLKKAIEMTSLFRKEKEELLKEQYRNKNILVNSETFEKDQLEKILAKDGCEKLRIYYGMDEEFKIHAILVPVNANNEDILPEVKINEEPINDEGIIDKGVRCPPNCPPPSELNP
jgi:hypothetical protein